MKGSEHVVTPEGWLSRGEAFVRGDGAQLAVLGGIPGERVRVRVTSSQGHVHRARFIAPAGKPHADRVAPSCERWATCGRCSWMHLTVPAQQAHRRRALMEAFDGLDVPLEVVPVEAGAVHTLELHAGTSDEGRLRLGVLGREGGLVAIPACEVATPTLREIMKVTAFNLIDMQIRPWRRGGAFRGVRARQSMHTGEVMLTLVFARAVPFARELVERIAGGVQEVRGAHAHWNDADEALVPDTGETTPIYGNPTLDEQFGDIRVRLAPVDAWPVTTAERDAWLAVGDALDPQKGDAVLEMGSGVGARTTRAAAASGWALGVDDDVGRVERARADAARSGFEAEFAHVLDAAEWTTVLARLDGRRPRVMADTGTRGLDDEAVARIVGSVPRRVVLLGSNPRAMARDVRALARGGLLPRSVRAWPILPHQPHLSMVAVLDHPDEAPPERRAPRRTRVR